MSVSPLDRPSVGQDPREDLIAYILLWTIPVVGAVAAVLGLG